MGSPALTSLNQSLEAAVADFNGTFLSFLGSPSEASTTGFTLLETGSVASGGEEGPGLRPEEEFPEEEMLLEGSETESESETETEEMRDLDLTVEAAVGRTLPLLLGSGGVDDLVPPEQLALATKALLGSPPPDQYPYSYARASGSNHFYDGEDDAHDDDFDDNDDDDNDFSPRGVDTPPTSTSSDLDTKPDPPEVSRDSPFIPALTRPRSAHLRTAYENENAYEPIASTSSPAAWEAPRPAPSFGSGKRAKSTKTPSATPAKAKKRTVGGKAKIEETYAVNSTPYEGGPPRKRTEIPAVEDDPSVKPYGCFYPSCMAALAGESGEGGGAAFKGKKGKKAVLAQLVEGESSFRTIKELREHCAIHKRAGEVPSETPFRCALDPCGKTFKVRPLSPFVWCSADEDGSTVARGLAMALPERLCERPLSRLDRGGRGPTFEEVQGVRPVERSVRKVSYRRMLESVQAGCRFVPIVSLVLLADSDALPAGLAYHLAHANNHRVTEEMILTFSATLTSKVRWWYKKTGRAFARAGSEQGSQGEGDAEEESEEEWGS